MAVYGTAEEGKATVVGLGKNMREIALQEIKAARRYVGEPIGNEEEEKLNILPYIKLLERLQIAAAIVDLHMKLENAEYMREVLTLERLKREDSSYTS